jgi:murein DD-endopeptidase MepM/ murein hydrolase activator NlpD
MLTPEEWEEIKRTMRPKAGGIPVSKSDDDGPVASDCVPDEGCSISHQPPPLSLLWTLGRYDENRVGMYESEMFQDTSKTIDGYAGRRTVHVGIDLGGPEGTPVHSFWHGVVHAVGYNPDLGDYGHVIVVRYSNGLRPEHADDDSDKNPASNNASASRVDSEHEKGEHFYALYGHLDSTVLRWRVGDAVRAGQVLAGLGSPGENGGWRVPHVHFQLSDSAPATHDMPGAVCVSDRDRALLEYPDPRYVLGPLY